MKCVSNFIPCSSFYRTTKTHAAIHAQDGEPKFLNSLAKVVGARCMAWYDDIKKSEK